MIGAVTRRTSVSHGSGECWNQLTSSVALVCQTVSQWSRTENVGSVAMPRPYASTSAASARAIENNRETLVVREDHLGPRREDGAMSRIGMPRIELMDASTAPMTAQSFFEGGDPGPIVAALANVPELLGPTLGFIGAALGPGATSTRHKEFAILRTSSLLGCRYCIHAHTTVALDVGLADLEVRALRGEAALEDAFSDPAELALIRWIDAMAGASGAVPDDLWADTRTHWADHLLVELSATIGATMFLNRFATGFELPTSTGVLERLERDGFGTASDTTAADAPTDLAVVS